MTGSTGRKQIGADIEEHRRADIEEHQEKQENKGTAAMNMLDVVNSIGSYTGLPEELDLFIKQVDYVYNYIQDLDEMSKGFLELKIRQKIKDRANLILINNNNPTQWEEIKSILKENCSVNESIENLINKIKLATFKNSVEQLYDHILNLLTKLNIKSGLEDHTPAWFNCEQNEDMALKLFISKLPSEPKLILQARNPFGFREAKKILIDTDNFHRDYNNPNRFVSQANNSRPIAPTFYPNIPNQNPRFSNIRTETYPNNFRQNPQHLNSRNPGHFSQHNYGDQRASTSTNSKKNGSHNSRLNNSHNVAERPQFSGHSRRDQQREIEVDHIRTEDLTVNEDPHDSRFQNFQSDTSDLFPV